jgi:hypothetical protein
MLNFRQDVLPVPCMLFALCHHACCGLCQFLNPLPGQMPVWLIIVKEKFQIVSVTTLSSAMENNELCFLDK